MSFRTRVLALAKRKTRRSPAPHQHGGQHRLHVSAWDGFMQDLGHPPMSEEQRAEWERFARQAEWRP